VPPRKRTTGPKPVEATLHADKRVNLPTADAQVFVDPALEAVRQVRWDRDPGLDPQLVWRGKDDRADELVTDAPPIYIQEKIDPRVLIENLRRTAAGQPEPEATLFETFDGLDELDKVDFYRHAANWSNRMILGDSLQVMASLAEREQLRGKVQTIYLDPPYGIKFGSNWQVSARKRDVKDGKAEDTAREAEQIKAFRDTWELGIGSYLTYLRDRLTVARDLLTDSGSVFVQIGDENVHLVRSVLDEVFGPENFMMQISFATTSGAGSFAVGTNVLANVLNYVIAFGKDIEAVKYRQLYRAKEVGGDAASLYTSVLMPDGSTRPLTASERRGEKLPDGARAFGTGDLTSQTTRTGQTTVFPVEIDGRVFTPVTGGWKTNRSGMDRLLAAGRVHAGRGRNLGYIRYVDDFPAAPISNLWADTLGQGQFGGDKLYVVQSATKVIERCILMSSDPGDLVLDPTCGSGTTAYVAEQWGRRWITIDTSRVALALARQRLMGAKFPFYLLADSDAGRRKEGEVTQKLLPPAPTSNDIRQGFVYERVQHITLKSIANNPDIREGMSRAEVDAAIKRHAEFETLYDRPYEDTSTVRVTGPFTVESLSPHRSLTFSPASEVDAARETASEHEAALDADAPTFEQTILDNLVRAGIQNGRRAERIEFASLDLHAGTHIQAVGDRRVDDESDDSTEATPSRIAVAIGPQYGTVSPAFIKAAAREALETDGVDLLAVLGFAFDPTALNVTDDDSGAAIEPSDDGFAEVAGVRRLGRLPVLFVRMNSDLLMGEDLKKTGAGNLFTVFGEPDIEVAEADDGQLVVTLRGVDVYDPTTGEVRSGDTSQVALWMIDTAYDEESFFVRHCYFTGGNDPYKRLKTALKAEIDADAWASLYATESRPFDRPESGRIAVKVINDYGDEVMKVFTV
jgi:adenine-specific DNA-methyltransferase